MQSAATTVLQLSHSRSQMFRYYATASGIGALGEVADCPSVRLSHAHSSEWCIIELWLI